MNIFKAIFHKPSTRTLLESSIVGTTFFMLGAIGIAIYLIFFTDMNIWFKVLTGISDLGILLFMFPNLVTSYLQLYSYKMEMGLYPIDVKLGMKVNEAKDLIIELNKLIESNTPEIKDEVIENEN